MQLRQAPARGGHRGLHHQEDPFVPAEHGQYADSGGGGGGHFVFQEQQSVTILAYMDPNSLNGTEPTAVAGREPWQFLGMSIREFPILIGAATGAAGLLFVILVLLAIWHCCRQRASREKAYSLEGECQQQKIMSHRNTNLVQSDSVVFLGVKPNQRYEVQLADALRETEKHGGMTRSISAPLGEGDLAASQPAAGAAAASGGTPMLCVLDRGRTVSVRQPRPVSQPVQFPVSISTQTERGIYAMGLPQIPEGSPRSCECLKEVPTASMSQHSSYDTFDDPSRPMYFYPVDFGITTLKTRSLPCTHCRPRPLSTEDDLNELYAKVNFSKKRKNRMRNDSAAAIAINKSRSTFLSLPFGHKDTDSLVDNEAVVVYDERTAL